MKYLVHLPLTYFARVCPKGSVVSSDRPQARDEIIYSIFELQCSDQCVPSIGESFPVARVTHDRFWVIQKVADVTRFPGQTPLTRIPVVILETLYVGTALPPETGVSLEEWARDKFQEIRTGQGIFPDMKILQDEGYKLWYGPKRQKPNPLIYHHFR